MGDCVDKTPIESKNRDFEDLYSFIKLRSKLWKCKCILTWLEGRRGPYPPISLRQWGSPVVQPWLSLQRDGEPGPHQNLSTSSWAPGWRGEVQPGWRAPETWWGWHMLHEATITTTQTNGLRVKSEPTSSSQRACWSSCFNRGSSGSSTSRPLPRSNNACSLEESGISSDSATWARSWKSSTFSNNSWE